MKKILLFLLSMLFSTVCFAKQITVQIIQHDKTTNQVAESSLVIEDELLNGFFDNGFIVSNTPAVVSESETQDLSFYNIGIGDAYEGGADFFVQVKLFYNEKNQSEEESIISKKKTRLEKIDWTVASAVTGNKIKESSISNYSSETEPDDLRVISSDLIFEIKRAIKA